MDRFPFDSPEDDSPGWIVIKVSKRRLRLLLVLLGVVVLVALLFSIALLLTHAFFP